MSLKTKLIKELSSVTLRGFRKTRGKELATEHGINLVPSILFHGINVLAENHGKEDFDHLPFDDMMMLYEADCADPTNPVLVKDAEDHQILMRIKNVNGTIIVFEYIRSLSTRKIYLMTIAELDKVNNAFIHIDGPDGLGEHITFNRGGFEIMRRVLSAIQNYERIVDTTVSKVALRKVRTLDLPKYTEYTLDMSRPIKRNNKVSNGNGTPKAEHDRRGHWRVYKSGKQVWVPGTTINKGSKRGRVDKDYTKTK